MKISLTDEILKLSCYMFIFFKNTDIIKKLSSYGFSIENQKFIIKDIKDNDFITIYHNNYKLIILTIEKSKYNSNSIKALLSQKKVYESLNTTKLQLFPIDGIKNIYPQLEGLILTNYSFDKYQSNPKTFLKELIIYNKKIDSNSKLILNQSLNIIDSISMIRDLGNEPANKLNPDVLGSFIKSRAKQIGFHCEELKYTQLKKLKMNSLISVSEGSRYKARMLIVSNKSKIGKNPIIIVGKGITFDSGGISLKKPNKMGDMKSDMLGLATVLGVIDVLKKNKSNKNIVGLLPIAENMIGSKATKPGDVITSMSGKTIEIRNTDAEGRLIMIDAITYGLRYKPKLIIDIATLTGMQEAMSCGFFSTLMGNSKKYLDLMKLSGEETHERVWEMPLYQEFVDLTKSDIADYKNDEFYSCKSSTILAGAFISNFVEKYPWLHLDIAGPSWSDKDYSNIKKGSTGIGLNLLVNFLQKV